MSRAQAALAAALAAAVLGALAPAPSARASATQESILMDDSLFVYSQPDQLDQRLAQAKALGVDRIRASVYWWLLAPHSDQKQKPSSQYPESDPRFYSQSGWDRYDRLVQLAAKHGLGVLFTLTGPAPLWVTGTPSGGRTDVEDTWNPSAADFRAFATAVGTRYSGTWRDEHEQPSLIPLLPPTKTEGPILPRVDHWSLWNEPNHGGWLTPQYQPAPDGKRLIPSSPRIYRGLLDAGWAGLNASGHASDTILIGETSPTGLHKPGPTRGIRPLRFIRELYCLDGRMRPYTGSAATSRGCPSSFDAAAFAGSHPGLFAASGWAQHPYALTTPPRAPAASKDDAIMSGIPRLTGTLDRIFGVYHQGAQLPIWITEYGYQSDPPDPTLGVSWPRQADWDDQGTDLAFRNPRVASMAQFLLVDDGPIKEFKPTDPRYWGTFQTGLVTLQGQQKPAYASFQHPIDVWPRRVRPGRHLRVFGQLRTAPAGSHPHAAIEFRAAGSKAWREVEVVTAGGAHAFVYTTVTARRSGSWRLAWQGGAVTRAIGVRVR